MGTITTGTELARATSLLLEKWANDMTGELAFKLSVKNN